MDTITNQKQSTIKLQHLSTRSFYFRSIAAQVFVGCITLALSSCTPFGAKLRLTDAQLLDRIKGGWLAKSAGGALGGPAEGKGADQNRILPTLNSTSITDCGNDDVYVQIPFLSTMDSLKNGVNGIYTASMKDYGDALKRTTFGLYCGNAAARVALNSGIDPPFCGGWPLNGLVKTGSGCSGPASEDIDWSIECQWIGFVTPGLPATCFKIDSISGHVIAYANGLYAGTFFDVASSIAPLYNDIHTVVKKASAAIPLQCDIHKNIDTLLWYHDNNPSKTYWDAMSWALGTDSQVKHTITDGGAGSRNNTTIVVIALLWGDANITNTVTYAARMGQDTDCNCGDACAILGSLLGYANLPPQWRSTYEEATATNTSCTFSGAGVSGWTYFKVIDSTVSIAKKCILQSGGSYSDGVYTIPIQDIPLPQWFEEYGKVPQYRPSN